MRLNRQYEPEKVAVDRRTALLAAAGLWCSIGPVAAQGAAPRVVFLNPGESVDRGQGSHWFMTARLMAAAAKTFGMQFEVLNAERDHLLMLRQAESVAKRADPPDYVVMVNRKMAALKMLQVFAGTPCKVLLMHNDLTLEQRGEIGKERGQMRHWIGTVTTDEVRGASLLMEELYRQLGASEPQVIGITGDRGTPVSLERAQGVSDFIARAGRGRQMQLAFGDWGAADAQSKVDVLLARYPQTNIIWAASDEMALGALRAVKARGAKVLVGGLGAWPDAVKSVAEGGLAASVGSHFFIGAWAMVLLHDYHQGKDFAANGAAAQKLDYLYAVNRNNALRFERAIFQSGGALDFSVYSKVLHPKREPYNFNLASLLGKG